MNVYSTVGKPGYHSVVAGRGIVQLHNYITLQQIKFWYIEEEGTGRRDTIIICQMTMVMVKSITRLTQTKSSFIKLSFQCGRYDSTQDIDCFVNFNRKSSSL